MFAPVLGIRTPLRAPSILIGEPKGLPGLNTEDHLRNMKPCTFPPPCILRLHCPVDDRAGQDHISKVCLVIRACHRPAGGVQIRSTWYPWQDTVYRTVPFLSTSWRTVLHLTLIQLYSPGVTRAALIPYHHTATYLPQFRQTPSPRSSCELTHFSPCSARCSAWLLRHLASRWC